jgi:acetyltransferase-like isoleucine patch superfamily enzyme
MTPPVRPTTLGERRAGLHGVLGDVGSDPFPVTPPLKAALHGLFTLLSLGQLARYRLARVVLGEARAFRGLAERLARFTGYSGVYLRAAAYRKVLRRSSREVQVGFGTVFSQAQAVLGDHVYIGRYCSLGWVEIGRDTMIADFVAIPSGGRVHQVCGATRTPPRLCRNDFRPIQIGEGTWIGSHATILADVGRFSIVGAGAVVTKPIPDFAVAVGVPARIVGSTLTTNHRE